VLSWLLLLLAAAAGCSTHHTQAVEQGRRVWANIRKILVFNMPVNLAQGTSVM
jgi:hypothetical protein